MQAQTVRIGTAEFPALGLGTWQWGDRWVWGFGRGYGEPDLRGAFLASIRGGVRLVDTAEVYGGGYAERLLGKLLRETRAPVLVATKFMPFPWRLTRASLLRALRRSLQRLGIPKVFLYQVHWPFPPRPVEFWAEALADAVEEGLCEHVGVSNFSTDQVRRAADRLARRSVRLASVQVSYSLTDRGPERNGLLETCRALQAVLLAYSPLGMGLLTGKYGPGNLPPGFRRARFARQLRRWSALLRALGEVARTRGKTPAQVALNWLVLRGAVPIPGAKNARQAEENAGALGWSLTTEEVALLDSAAGPP
ncbi:MAG: aldo/keto reductase [Armatimonadota bacterium]|nr:aldo/keto reductase [Armatimonadota bacterium]MDR7445093.1 aldo/keto reductase [Armatimonadota bacterium]MDR7569877.1 aldo/keto reductase [Armatimonadota bacterium]MDR7614178.1 aldo/keto reductase [Armatimonadota bacterium]